MIADRNDYKYVAGDLFARSAATGDYLVAIDGTSLFGRQQGSKRLCRGEDLCWLWECINTRRCAIWNNNDSLPTTGNIPYQFRRADHPFAHYGVKSVIDNTVSAFNALLDAHPYAYSPSQLSKHVWHHQSSVPDEILIPDYASMISLPQRWNYMHTPYDVYGALSEMERSFWSYCYSTPSVQDWSGFTQSATVTPVNYQNPPTEAELLQGRTRWLLGYMCNGAGSYSGTQDSEYYYATFASAGAVKISFPYLEHVKAIYPVYKLYISSTYFAGGMNPTISESAGMSSYVVSTTPRTMDANHTIEISPSQEIIQACPLSTLASELNLQHGFTQDTPSTGTGFMVSWYIQLVDVSLIIELDDSVTDIY